MSAVMCGYEGRRGQSYLWRTLWRGWKCDMADDRKQLSSDELIRRAKEGLKGSAGPEQPAPTRRRRRVEVPDDGMAPPPPPPLPESRPIRSVKRVDTRRRLPGPVATPPTGPVDARRGIPVGLVLVLLFVGGMGLLRSVRSEGGSTPIPTTLVASSGGPVEPLEVPQHDGWRQYCTEARLPTRVVSAWRVDPVILDGVPTSVSEWTEATAVFLPLEAPWGTPQRFNPCAESMTAWFMNDETWLYGLYYVPWDGPVDPDDSGGFMLFRGASCCGVDSDIGVVSATGVWDGYGWDESRWHPDLEAPRPGTIDIEGTGSHDGNGYWFEWRKRLDSGDPNDWELRPGQTIGNVATQTWFLTNLYDTSQRFSHQHAVTMTLATGNN